MKNLLKRILLHYRMWKDPYFKALIQLNPEYVMPSTWDDPCNTKLDPQGPQQF